MSRTASRLRAPCNFPTDARSAHGGAPLPSAETRRGQSATGPSAPPPAAAESDAEADRRKKTLGDALAAVSLHVAMASEAGEFTMRDVVLEAAREVRKRAR